MPENQANRIPDAPIHRAARPDTGVSWRLLSDRDPDRLCPSDRQRILGVLRYTKRAGPVRFEAYPQCPVPLRPLDGRDAAVVLLGRKPTERAPSVGIECRSDGDLLFGVVFDAAATGAQIQGATRRAYRSLLRTSAELGYPHVCRIWNYLPDINAEPNGLEVYRAFSMGRREALDDWGRIGDNALAAACAIGTRQPGLRIAFLASRTAGVTLSNSRQHEAYRYPPEYGPKSPAFSRAVLMAGTAERCLHVSGTASILGHRTAHEGNLGGQIQETLRNLNVLVRPLGLNLHEAGGETLLTVYLRRAEDLAAADSLLEAGLGKDVKRLFLQGDICRSSLLVEIEGIISLIGRRV